MASPSYGYCEAFRGLVTPRARSPGGGLTVSGAHRERSDVDCPVKTRLTMTWTTSLNDQEQVFPLYRLTQPEKKKKKHFPYVTG